MPKKPPAVTTVIAVLLVVVFVASLYLMVTLRDTKNWDRLVYLLGGLEPLVYSGAGALFGTTIARREADSARADAEAARRETADTKASAAGAERDAAALRAVKEAIGVKRKNEQATLHQGAKPGPDEPMSDLDELAELIERLTT